MKQLLLRHPKHGVLARRLTGSASYARVFQIAGEVPEREVARKEAYASIDTLEREHGFLTTTILTTDYVRDLCDSV